jgi:hypothetical protein
MDEIKELMDAWKDGDYINPDALISAYQAVELLVAKVEELENKLIILEGGN